MLHKPVPHRVVMHVIQRGMVVIIIQKHALGGVASDFASARLLLVVP